MDQSCDGQLPNLEWWDSVTYEDLTTWVPTVGKYPQEVDHGVAGLRGAVAKHMRHAQERGDAVTVARAGKLFTFLDRLIFCVPVSKRGGKKQTSALSNHITNRLRLAWRGDWGALWRIALSNAQQSSRRGGRQPTAAEDARAIEALVKDQLVGKALG